ncbi:hypothetical protein PHYBOEH_007553 [Phytophthora boehmeriae]|uniref:Ankyrin repeat protein n=1 Tax=Phytophthora boehmeriae TaxID=109152 RepID=A0A8T1WAL5_9STRA|nr:hypothetical protein PHYBOEH_007553 [Phytophthora boehmeriae]
MAEIHGLQQQEEPPLVTEIERAWLQAARDSNVDQMKNLRVRFPEILDLKRKVHDMSQRPGPGSRSSATNVFCSWERFHLGTIGASTLHTATWHGVKSVVEYLLESGQDPDTEDNTGMTPIMLVIMHHDLQAQRCVFRDRKAIQRNLIMDCREEDAERTRHTVDLVQLLLRFHADVDKRCNSGKAALHLATTDDTLEVAKLLLDNGASVDIQDQNGKSPLFHCVPSSLLVANLLLQRGAKVQLPDYQGVTPLALILQINDLNMLQIVLNHHEFVVTSEGEDFAGAVLMAAIDASALSTATFLLEEGYVAATHQNDRGETAMHRAILKHDAAMTHLLRRFDVNAQVLSLTTTTGESCLHYAARYSSPEELRRLLVFYNQRCNEGNDCRAMLMNSADSSGRSALLLAGTTATDLRDEKTRLLMDAGVRLLSSDTIIEFAAANASSSPRLAFPNTVQSCLNYWLAECAESCPEDVRTFCLKHLSIIASSRQRQRQVSFEALNTLLLSGHAVGSMSLLLSLPFDRAVTPALLENLRVFGRQQNHLLVLALHRELFDAWTSDALRND